MCVLEGGLRVLDILFTMHFFLEPALEARISSEKTSQEDLFEP